MSAVNSCEECRIMTLNQEDKVWDCSKVNSQKVHVRKHHIQSMSIDLHSSNNKRVVSGYVSPCWALVESRVSPTRPHTQDWVGPGRRHNQRPGGRPSHKRPGPPYSGWCPPGPDSAAVWVSGTWWPLIHPSPCLQGPPYSPGHSPI